MRRADEAQNAETFIINVMENTVKVPAKFKEYKSVILLMTDSDRKEMYTHLEKIFNHNTTTQLRFVLNQRRVKNAQVMTTQELHITVNATNKLIRKYKFNK